MNFKYSFFKKFFFYFCQNNRIVNATYHMVINVFTNLYLFKCQMVDAKCQIACIINYFATLKIIEKSNVSSFFCFIRAGSGAKLCTQKILNNEKKCVQVC